MKYQSETQVTKPQGKVWLTILDTTANNRHKKVKTVNGMHRIISTDVNFSTADKIFGNKFFTAHSARDQNATDQITSQKSMSDSLL